MNKRTPLIIATMTKEELEAWVIATAQSAQWDARLTRDIQYGSPSILLVKYPRVIFAECLPDGVRRDRALTIAQRRWLGTLGACGFETYQWRSRDQRVIKEILSTKFDFVSALRGELPIGKDVEEATQRGINKGFERIGLSQFGRSA